jgi:hypothetical protein
MNRETQLAIFAIVAALGLVAVVTVEVASMAQEAEARGCDSSFPNSGVGGVGFNASQGRCLGH